MSNNTVVPITPKQIQVADRVPDEIITIINANLAKRISKGKVFLSNYIIKTVLTEGGISPEEITAQLKRDICVLYGEYGWTTEFSHRGILFEDESSK